MDNLTDLIQKDFEKKLESVVRDVKVVYSPEQQEMYMMGLNKGVMLIVEILQEQKIKERNQKLSSV